MDKDIIKEAYEVITEWGITEDDFIMQNFRQFMSGGNPDDNSIQLGEFYRTQLQTIVDLGLVEAKRLVGSTVDTELDLVGVAKSVLFGGGR